MSAFPIGQLVASLKAPKVRRSGEPVWRNSYYEGQVEGRIWRPFAGGNRRGAKRRIGAVLKSARELERRTRLQRQADMPGVRNGVLGQIALDVLDVLYNRFLDYQTGRLDPSISTISAAIGHSYNAVHRALTRLRKHGFLHWVRRSRKTENEGAGPQVEQISNAYVLLVPSVIKKMVAYLIGRPPLPDDERQRREQQAKDWQDMLNSLTAAEYLHVTWDGDSTAGETLARIAAAIDARDAKERESSTVRETGGLY